MDLLTRSFRDDDNLTWRFNSDFVTLQLILKSQLVKLYFFLSRLSLTMPLLLGKAILAEMRGVARTAPSVHAAEVENNEREGG